MKRNYRTPLAALYFTGAMLALAVTNQAQALPQINGTIAFIGGFTNNVVAGEGTLDFNNVTNASYLRTGDFADVFQDTFSNVDFGPISVAAGAVTVPINPMWALQESVANGGEAAAFELSVVTEYVNDANGVIVEGLGTIRMDGFANTTGAFTLDTASRQLSFDADTTAVDAPGIPALVAFGLVGLAAARKRRAIS